MKPSHKLNWLILALFFCCGTKSLPAQTLKDVFTSSETSIFYLGIDYTLARLIDDASASAIEVRDRYFPAINDIVVNEPKKYNLQKAFNKTNIEHDLGLVAKRNNKINAEEIISTNSADYSRLKEEDINNLVKGFDFEKKKGLGLLFVVEGMSKGKKGASIWVTFVEMGTNKVLLTERMEGKTSMSFGFRNYWAYPIYNVIENIEKGKYKDWKRKYGS